MKQAPTKLKEEQVKDKDVESSLNAIQILHQDHQRVKELFFQFSQSEDKKEKHQLVQTILEELFVHATVEEQVVYPAIREDVEDSEDMMDEADTEHHVVKLLMSELASMKPDDDHFDSKVTVLCELVSHHVAEEEKEIFQKMNESGMDLEDLGSTLTSRKEALKKASKPDLKVPTATSSRAKSKRK